MRVFELMSLFYIEHLISSFNGKQQSVESLIIVEREK